MNSLGQWVHQHNLVVVLTFVLGTALTYIVLFRGRSIRSWVAWSVVAGLGVWAGFALRTPPATLSEYTSSAEAGAFSPDSDPHATRIAYEEPSIQSVEEIQSLLRRGGKHTLVELYSDFGFS